MAFVVSDSVKISSKSKLPEKYSFFTIKPKNIIMSALKMAEDGQGIILRLYEAYGKNANGVISFRIPSKSVVETDLLEHPLLNPMKSKNVSTKLLKKNSKTSSGEMKYEKLKISVKKHEIKTIKLQI